MFFTSQNRHDTLKQKTALSFVTYYIVYVYATVNSLQLVTMVTQNYVIVEFSSHPSSH
jgi:hypothetical protein